MPLSNMTVIEVQSFGDDSINSHGLYYKEGKIDVLSINKEFIRKESKNQLNRFSILKEHELYFEVFQKLNDSVSRIEFDGDKIRQPYNIRLNSEPYIALISSKGFKKIQPTNSVIVNADYTEPFDESQYE